MSDTETILPPIGSRVVPGPSCAEKRADSTGVPIGTVIDHELWKNSDCPGDGMVKVHWSDDVSDCWHYFTCNVQEVVPYEPHAGLRADFLAGWRSCFEFISSKLGLADCDGYTAEDIAAACAIHIAQRTEVSK